MSTQQTAKITKFHEDRRLSVTSALRSICLAGLLVTVVYCIFAFHEDLNTVNLKRIISYIDRLTFRTEAADYFTLDSGLEGAYAPFDVGVASCSGGTFRFTPPFKDMDFTCQVKYSNPYIETCGSYLYVCDVGGGGISRLNSYSLLGETTLESDIISMTANSSGEIAVITDEDGYRSALTVMDRRFKEIYKWQTSDHFAFMAALSPDGDTAAVLCVGQKEGRSDFYVRLQPTDGGECRTTIDLGDMKTYSLQYYSNGTLMILGESGLYAYDSSGKLKDSYALPAGSLISFSHSRESYCAISLKGDAGDTSRVMALDDECRPVYDRIVPGSVKDMDLSGDILAYCCSDGLYKVTLSSREELLADAQGVRDVLITETGSVTAIYTDHARIISFETGD